MNLQEFCTQIKNNKEFDKDFRVQFQTALIFSGKPQKEHKEVMYINFHPDNNRWDFFPINSRVKKGTLYNPTNEKLFNIINKLNNE